jgi:phosphatidylinositol phospholipase C delta
MATEGTPHDGGFGRDSDFGTERVPPFSMSPGDLAIFSHLLRTRGVPFRKISRRGRPAMRLLRLEGDGPGLKLTYLPSVNANNSLTVAHIWRIDTGTEALRYMGSEYPDEKLPCLIAVTACKLRTSAVDVKATALEARFILEAPDLQTRTIFEQALAFEVARRRTVAGITAMQTRIAEVWLDADVDRSGSIDRYELEAALVANGVPLERGSIEALIAQFDTDRSGLIEFSEFDLLIREIMNPREPTVESLFETFSSSQKGGGRAMTAQDFMRFLFHAQGESINAETALTRVKALSQGRNTATLCLEDFVFMFLANPKVNSWMRQEHERVFMDMAQPLHHYFIASSHNTALEGDQLVSKCTASWVGQVLETGARCIELEIKDFDLNDDGIIPVVHRRYSRCQTCSLVSVLKAIKKKAFATTPYPLIVLLEFHAPVDMSRAVSLIKRELGDLLFTPEDREQLASAGKSFCPKDMQRRVLIGAAVDDEMAADGHKVIEGLEVSLEASTIGVDQMPARHHDFLRKIVTLQIGRHADSGECKWSPLTITSATDGQGVKRLLKTRWQVVDRCAEGFLRIYPTKSDSQNTDPGLALALGAQMIATNWQTCDGPQRRLESMFRTNGGAGYLLKPVFMRKHQIMPDATAYIFSVTVIQGFQIPRPAGLNPEIRLRTRVVASVVGTGDAQRHEESWFGVDSHARPPFSPVYSGAGATADTYEPYERTFRVKGLDVAVVNFLVVHEGDDDVQMPIASATIQFSSLRLGYRAVPLYSVVHNGELPHAALMCHFRIEQV